jgi:hypothetical protein
VTKQAQMSKLREYYRFPLEPPPENHGA